MKFEFINSNRKSSVISRPLSSFCRGLPAVLYTLNAVRYTLHHSVPLLLCPFEPLHQPATSLGSQKPRKRKSTNYYVRIYQKKMQNKPNFPHFSPENDDYAKKQSQFKPNFFKSQNESFFVDIELYDNIL
jgi:hypothetical protein